MNSFNFIDPCVEELETLLSNDDNGLTLLTEGTIARLGALKIKVYAKEHPPPHFHVEFKGEENSFSITDCSPLFSTGLNKHFKKIERWFAKNQSKLIQAWNDSRPANCPVGPI